MAQISAFRGIRYNKEKIADLSRVITPPYDVISPAEAQLYYLAHPANMVRLIIPQPKRGDNAFDNKYTRAGKEFRQWLEQKILIQEPEPALYAYQQKYKLGREIKVRTGLFSLVKLEDFSKGIIFPHEETHSGPKKDRMRLLRQVRANLSPVFGLYDDPRGKIKHVLELALKKRPVFKIKEASGTEHRIWKITCPDLIKQIRTAMRAKKIYIADGHHRYETALAYCWEKEVQARRTKVKKEEDFQLVSGQPGYRYIMMCLVSLEDEGLIILPIHRVLLNSCCGTLKDNEIMKKIARYFDIKVFTTPNRKHDKKIDDEDNLSKIMSKLQQYGQKQRCLAMYTSTCNFYLLTLRQRNILDTIMPDKPSVYRNLDVNILHRLIIEYLLGLKPTEGQIIYTRDAKEALGLVKKNKGKLAFFLNPTSISEVRRVALSGQKMPQKSTYFYPKIPTGLVINKL